MKAMTRTLSLILIGVVIRSLYIHDDLYTKIFQENYWVIFYVVGIISVMAALIMWLQPIKKINDNK